MTNQLVKEENAVIEPVIVEPEKKICRGCKNEKELSCFSKQRTKLRSQCKTCVSTYAKANYKLKRQKYYTAKYVPTGRPRGRPKKIVPVVEEIAVN